MNIPVLFVIDVDEKLNTVEDYDILTYYWATWHDAIASNINASDYSSYISYQNILAQSNGNLKRNNNNLLPRAENSGCKIIRIEC